MGASSDAAQRFDLGLEHEPGKRPATGYPISKASAAITRPEHNADPEAADVCDDDPSPYIGWPEAIAGLDLRSAIRAVNRGYLTLHASNGRRAAWARQRAWARALPGARQSRSPPHLVSLVEA